MMQVKYIEATDPYLLEAKVNSALVGELSVYPIVDIKYAVCDHRGESQWYFLYTALIIYTQQ